MTAVQQSDSTYAAIERKVRRLTASASEASLSSTDIQEATNTFYNNDFPYAIKVDQMKSVYTFFSRPNIDRYPLDVNFNQGIRAPLYVDGIQGYFTKDRVQFNNIWPRFPTRFSPISGDGVTQLFNFTIQGPFLSKEVTLGGVDTTGTAISISDDGEGNLLYDLPNPIVSVPTNTAVYVQTIPPTIPIELLGLPIAGMKNVNTINPGNIKKTPCGTVDYVGGAFSVNFALIAGTPGVTPIAGQQMTLRVSQYQTGRPNSMLFWNNEFTIRPVPKFIHKIEIESYLTPVQFMQTTDHPILNQWWQYISYGVAKEILRERQDMQGVAALDEGFKRQEGLVLERQGVEEVGVANGTIYNSLQGQIGGNWGNNGNWGG